MSVENNMSMHPMVAQIFQSGAKLETVMLLMCFIEPFLTL